MGLEDYKEIVATIASLTAMSQMFAGVFICKDIYKRGTTRDVDPMPFIGGTGMALLMLQYVLILNDTAMISVNLFGVALNIAYSLFYYAYCPNKGELIAKIGKIAALVITLIGYAHLENPDKVENRFGIIVTTLLFILIASPLFGLGEIIRTKSTAGLPFPLIFMGTIVSAEWLLYGFIIDNGFVIFQNAVAFTLSAAQLSLFVIYPSKPSVESESKPEKKEN